MKKNSIFKTKIAHYKLENHSIANSNYAVNYYQTLEEAP